MEPLLIFAVMCIAALLYFHIAAYRLRRCTIQQLLAMVEPVPREGLAAIALDYLNPVHPQLGAEPGELWSSLGGLGTILSMRRNARILMVLASYVETWNYVEGVIVTERMRRDALQLRRAIFHLIVELFFHPRRGRFPFYLHEAVSAYYLMRQRLLVLYESNHSGLYPQLAAVI